MAKPLAIDLFCGLGGWTEGLLAEGYEVIGYDIEAHEYGDHKYPATLVIQDVLTIHGSQFKDADLIVASPPCQEFSYMAMPWKLAKAKAAAIRADKTGAKLADLTRLFDACFRIQREASEAAGRDIPLVVENVRGAQPWVGRARYNYGSFYPWGDVPALMPSARSYKSTGMNWSDQTKRGQDFTRIAGNQAIKNNGGSWFNIGSPGQKITGKNPVHELSGVKIGNASERRWEDRPVKRTRDAMKGTKQGGDWFAEARKGGQGGTSASFGSKSPQRRFASAMIAKIPLPLSRYIAATFKPKPQPEQDVAA